MIRSGVGLLVGLAAGLAGCGRAAVDQSARVPVSTLCIDVALPLSGPAAGAGRGLLAGLRMTIPASGLTLGNDRVRICQVDDAAAPARAPAMAVLMREVLQASSDRRTIAWFGAVSGTAARDAETVLGQAGIALITAAGPVSAPASTDPTAQAPRPDSGAPTALYLLPSTVTQADAVRGVRTAHGCVPGRHGRPATCTVTSTPLCSGITASITTVPRFCVVAGPDLSRWPSPAVAYGDSAGRLLVRTLTAIHRSGGDVADRATVLRRLLGASLAHTPIGPIRFDDQGAIGADDFTVYSVEPDGELVPSRTFITH